MQVEHEDDFDGPTRDANGDWIFRLVTDDHGRSALDAANEGLPTETIKGLLSLEHETIKPYGYGHTRSLTEAARLGKLAAVQRLLAAGADPHAKLSMGLVGAPVEEAAKKGYIDIVRVLLEAESEKIGSDAYSIEAVERAVREGQHDEVARLREAKKFVDQAGEYRNAALQLAVGCGGVELVRMLVESGADVNAEPDVQHHSALTRAAKGGFVDVVWFLLDQGAKVEGETRNGRHFPLRAAAEGGSLEVVKMLVEAGANPNLSYRVLHAAGHAGHADVLEYLIRAGADVNTMRAPLGDGQETALQETARGGHVDCVSALIRAGADVHVPAGRKGNTALQAAAKSGNPAVVQRLLAEGADVNAPAGEWGRTALQAAAEIGSIDVIIMLLDAGAVVESEVAPSRCFSIELAVKGGHAAVAEVLLGATNLSALTEDAGGTSPITSVLVAAVQKGYAPLVDRLLDAGVPLRGGRHSNNNTVMIAAEAGHTSILKRLIEAGGDIDGGSWPSPLQLAVKGGHVETVRFLISEGADIDLAVGRSEPPLHMAAKAQNFEMFKLLLNSNAVIYKVSYTEKTVRNLAEEGGSQEILNLLSEREAVVPRPPPSSKDDPVVLSSITKADFCSRCKKLPLAPFFGRSGYEFHPSLNSLLKSVRAGCPFCMFFWKRIGVDTITIPQPSICMIYQSGNSVWSQIEEPYPEDIECPLGLRADFTVDMEPFDGKRQPLPGDTRSPVTYSQIRHWLDKCCQSHAKCKVYGERSFLPTRLLDLSGWENRRTLKLVETEQLSNKYTFYMTLSHYSTQDTATAGATTSDNIGARYSSIDSNCLPLTFQHAVEVASTLDIDYLWIADLCIIQDSEEDLSNERSLIAKIFQNSFLTIAVGASEDLTSGLFRTFDTTNDCVEVPCKSDSSSPTTNEATLVRMMKPQPTWTDGYYTTSLSKRAWALQEREFSSRVLYYTATHVLWECRKFKATEVQPTRNITPDLTAEDKRLLDDLPALPSTNNADANVEDIYTHWYRAIKSYTTRRLTSSSDILPALSSLAHRFSQHLPSSSTYIAGLWSSDLLRGLSWASYKDYDRRREWTEVRRRHTEYVAPSWSWASVVGPTCYPALSQSNQYHSGVQPQVHGQRKTGTASVLSHSVTLSSSSSNPFGPLSPAHPATLHVRAPLISGVLGYDASSNWLGQIIQLRDFSGERIVGNMWFDIASEREQNGVKIKVVQCLYLFTKKCTYSSHGRKKGEEGGEMEDACGFGLAVVPVEGKVKTYRRVGHVQCLMLRESRDVEADEIVLI